MSTPSVTVEGLSKKYRIGGVRQDYHTIRDRIAGLFRRHREAPEAREFWALRNVGLQIQEGEAVGLIGHNGAGKSTLLKILSRITEPTEGRVEIRGRVASLLEVGTGFHPELTGRENIFLNGAVLGMTRAEIRKNFDEIVEFAEVAQFLDTPVKRYSSGMYVRLAFSVAAHLSADVLLIDEVLAVGDARFQEKCLGKMNELTAAGDRTILFVSHNMAAVKTLCSRAIYLESGKLAYDGEVAQALGRYAAGGATRQRREFVDSACHRLRLRIPRLLNAEGRDESTFAFGEPIALRFEAELLEPMDGLDFGFAVVDSLGQRIFTSHMADDPVFSLARPVPRQLVVETNLDLPSLAPGRYRVTFGAQDERGFTIVYSEDEIEFEIVATARGQSGAIGVLWHTTSWRQP